MGAKGRRGGPTNGSQKTEQQRKDKLEIRHWTNGLLTAGLWGNEARVRFEHLAKKQQVSYSWKCYDFYIQVDHIVSAAM